VLKLGSILTVNVLLAIMSAYYTRHSNTQCNITAAVHIQNISRCYTAYQTC